MKRSLNGEWLEGVRGEGGERERVAKNNTNRIAQNVHMGNWGRYVDFYVPP